MSEEAKANQNTVMFFPNGATAVFIDEEQVPELQQPWLTKFIAFLEEQGQDPTTFTYMLPHGKEAKVFRTGDGWNWGIAAREVSGNE